jgi:hypothetical protein
MASNTGLFRAGHPMARRAHAIFRLVPAWVMLTVGVHRELPLADLQQLLDDGGCDRLLGLKNVEVITRKQLLRKGRFGLCTPG